MVDPNSTLQAQLASEDTLKERFGDLKKLLPGQSPEDVEQLINDLSSIEQQGSSPYSIIEHMAECLHNFQNYNSLKMTAYAFIMDHEVYSQFFEDIEEGEASWDQVEESYFR